MLLKRLAQPALSKQIQIAALTGLIVAMPPLAYIGLVFQNPKAWYAPPDINEHYNPAGNFVGEALLIAAVLGSGLLLLTLLAVTWNAWHQRRTSPPEPPPAAKPAPPPPPAKTPKPDPSCLLCWQELRKPYEAKKDQAHTLLWSGSITCALLLFIALFSAAIENTRPWPSLAFGCAFLLSFYAFYKKHARLEKEAEELLQQAHTAHQQ